MVNTVSQASYEIPTHEEAANEEGQRPGCCAIIQDFSLNTSTHGLPGIARSESKYNRFYWSVVFLIFTGTMIYFIVRALSAYLGYPTQIDLNIDVEWPQNFPAFSFCNAGAIRLDQFIGPFLNYTNAVEGTNTNDTSTLFPAQLILVGNFINDILNNNGSMEPFYYSLPSMLYSCSYNGQACSAADFIPFVTTAYGLCYTFNAQLKDGGVNSVRSGSLNGGDGKLELGLYVHSHQYVPYLVDSKCTINS